MAGGASDGARTPSGAAVSDDVSYERRGAVALITLNRPDRRNAQGADMTYALDGCFYRFSRDNEARVAVLRGAGPHFSAGHDVHDVPQDHDHDPVSLWGHPHGKPGAEWIMAYEQDAFLGMCRRWREVPKPVIAMVHGACVGGALALAWACDLIIASSDAFFADPVVRLGCPGIEFFCHPWALGSRFAREFLFLGERISAQRAYEVGMVNRVFDAAELEEQTLAIAARIAAMPSFGLTLAKMAVNQAEDAMGMKQGIDAAFSLHQLAHAHNINMTGGSPMLVGLDDLRSTGGDRAS
ncbi:enoyl-CoA hydratase [Frankia sp. Cr1]|uniref:enoyl-CoA hydratase n=1 Tax=unclassified Frankia TaxID=2632575 RepID=UPI003A0FEF0F